MAKIMNVGLISLSMVFMALSFAVAGEIHPGLKNAIDNGDYKMAKNLIEKVGVKDIYCPVSLKVKDAEKIYAQLLAENPMAILNGSANSYVSLGFAGEYLKVSCNGKKDYNYQICEYLYEPLVKDKLNPDSLLGQWLHDKEGICLSKETIKACNYFYHRTGNDSLKMEVLRIMDQKKLLKYTETVEEKESGSCVEKKIKNFDRGKCFREAERRYRNALAECNKRQRHADLCRSGAVESYTYEERMCDNGGTERVCSSKTVKKKNVIEPFSYEIKELYEKDFDKWQKMDDAWVKKVSLLRKYIDEDELINKLIKDYKDKGDLDVRQLVGNCKLAPSFDKKVQKKMGFELFSCKNIMKNYPISCDEYSIRTFGTTLNGINPTKQACENGRWRGLKKNEDVGGVCNNSRKGEVVEKYICDSVWKPLAAMDLPETPCENDAEVQSKYNKELSYKCVNGMWIARIKEENVFIDVRNWAYYNFKQIGNQFWMTENLNFETDSSWCYDNEKYNCDLFGRLYTWAAAMDSAGVYSENGKGCGDGVKCSPTNPVRGICPEGWHLPTQREFVILWNAVGGSDVATKMLKSASGWNQSGNGTDAYGFSALPSGSVYEGAFDNIGNLTFFWSSNEHNAEWAYSMDMGFPINFSYDAGNISDHGKKYGFPVRCVKDE